ETRYRLYFRARAPRTGFDLCAGRSGPPHHLRSFFPNDCDPRLSPTGSLPVPLFNPQTWRKERRLAACATILSSMNDQAIQEIVAEIRPLMIDRAPGKIFQLSTFSLVIDFRLRDHGDLF